MNTSLIILESNLELFIKDVFVLENKDCTKNSSFPFFADCYSGVIFCQSKNKAFRIPRKKELPKFFLYGQTIEPIKLSMKGAYLLIVL